MYLLVYRDLSHLFSPIHIRWKNENGGMLMSVITSDFFLGAITGHGFADLFHLLYDETADRAVILKGGSGTGKSTLLKRVAAAAEREGRGAVERIHCSSDPDSLDAVRFRDGKCCIVDGTAPHAHDPRWPGAVDQMINLGDHWQEEALRCARFKIVELTRRKKRIYEEIYRYLDAAADACRERRNLAEPFVRYDKMNAAADHMVGTVSSSKNRLKGTETRRVLYAVTPKGYMGYDDTIAAFAQHVTQVKDDYGVADLYMSKLRAGFLETGRSIITCMNVLSEDGVDAILVPEEKKAFVTSHFLREYGGKANETVNLKVFLAAGDLRAYKARLTFHRKLAAEMVAQAVEKLKEVRELHGMLEQIYGAAMDFQAIDRLSDEVIKSFGLS